MIWLLLVLPTVLSSPQNIPRQSIPGNLPGNWSTAGCYTDNPGTRTLTGATTTDPGNMTVENCIAFCDAKDFIFAGVEFRQECCEISPVKCSESDATTDCDNFIRKTAVNSTSSNCNLPCSGDASELCGGAGFLNLFWSGAEPPPPPSIPASIGDWVLLGCYSDNVDGQGRTLLDGMNIPGSQVSLETCTSACFAAGMPLAGTEFADECYCGMAISNGGISEPLTDCSMVCAGNSSEFCGGPNRLTLYNYTGTDLPAPPPVGGGGGGNNGGGVTAIATGLPEPWAYVGCFVDGAHGRVLTTEIPDDPNMTMENCVATCSEKNFTIAGGEFSVQCFCGNALIQGAAPAPAADCNMPCGGNSTQACGAGDRLSIYSTVPDGNITIIPVPTAQNTSLPDLWEYQGCLMEKPNGEGNIFPWQLILQNNNSATTCLSQCAAFGYTAGGMEISNQCFCGDVSDVVASGMKLTAESDCNSVCSGDPAFLCGGPFRVQYYTWKGQGPVWDSPAAMGRYEFFVPGLIAPLIATLNINNKVTFLEKSPSFFDNTTGAYELDISLAHNFTAAYRTMHVKSNVFCSGSIILPDKAGRQLNVGGWSEDSTKGVRLYTPDGVPGVNGTNDWEENFQELKLQRQRWYPTAAMLPNGTVLVMGGEIGANDLPQPNLEILPTPKGGDTTVFLDWLNRTDPNNLYPFIFALPSGNIFVMYYNEARILNPHTFDTIKTLPNAPAAVNDPDGGRTYPLEGAAVLLPQKWPYTDPLEVLICGGSTPGPHVALDNCVSIQPEAENPRWVLERMPSRRVMPCMVPLADGTFMIMNGAVSGAAGFGLASDPNLSAVLYDPSKPVNQRIALLNTTIVARLYHSEAILLPDGRVLVSGSDPEDKINPEELRVEVYIPPYLDNAFVQPSFTISNTDWAYGSEHSVTVTVHQGTAATIRASLIAATSSTHGNTFGARVIFPKITCKGNAGGAGNVCVITAPPNANISPPGWHQLFILDGPTPSHSTWVRIGGDPAKLGNWPPLPDFTLPGI
ncbi:Copper radical oxidase [Mycena kentingensis (nom. inval.)]|nr:Copper radical oxidase [Mycena kentingensis (nom. inval.)]